MNAYPQLDPRHPKRHLSQLHTPLGARSVYDSISFCNRCGCCSQACLSYRTTQEEAFSPRGRNQLARLLAEEKIKFQDNPSLIYDTLSSCSLCGACTAACAGKIPTAEHMVEVRRALNIQLLPGMLYKLLSWRETSPKFFHFTMCIGNLLRKTGVIKMARQLRITRLPFLQWINHADDILPRRIVFINKKKAAAQYTGARPKAIYLPSFEAQYCNPQIARDALKILAEQSPLIWFNRACGLFSYTYGDVRQTRKTARRLINAWLKTDEKLPLVTDSVDAYTMIMRYPQLFAGNALWQKKAEEFAQNVRLITDYLSVKPGDLRHTRIRLETTCLLGPAEEALNQAHKILKTHFKKNLVEYSYNELAAPPAGYGFVNPVRAEAAFYAKTKDTARAQVNTVVTLSGLSALELDFYLKKHYPCSTAQHLTRLNG